MNCKYNLDIPLCSGTIYFSEVKALPEFGSKHGLFHVGHKALFVMGHITREKILEYVRTSLLAPVIETTEREDGVIYFELQMVPVVMDERG